ncbi:hypothetical protein HMPREF0208_02711 [Citrobacter koseri]|nr:hypothetical protein HMPREF3220_03950 [Citrobacter koseri]KXA03184.1 hypothetical protein HMPREF3207_01974 [Citrobacter koseri]KXB43320.1 hypothetical protein HMPREF0208_02711 [Citrobacter koseri]
MTDAPPCRYCFLHETVMCSNQSCVMSCFSAFYAEHGKVED